MADADCLDGGEIRRMCLGHVVPSWITATLSGSSRKKSGRFRT
jgi:hypothetical protein